MRLPVCALLAVFILPLSARSEVPSEIPFQYRDGLIWLAVQVTGRDEPLNFLLDSGAGVSVLDLETAHSLGLKLLDGPTVQCVNGQASAYRVNSFRAVCSGNVLPESVLAIDLRTFSRRCHQSVNGILGVDFFRGRIIQIDFSAGRVRLLKNCALNLVNSEMLPIKVRNGTFCVPVRIANNPARWTRLDTGCDAALEWVASESEKKRIGQVSVGLADSSDRYIDTCVQIGEERFTAVRVGVHQKQIFPGEVGLLGNALLSKFRVTIDEPRSRVILERVH